MNARLAVFARGVGWTVTAFALTQLIRFATSVALTRILAPELFGIMIIINSLRTGVDLTLDVGIGQNIIQNKRGDTPSFYNTAWTIQLTRGVLIAIVCAMVATPLAQLYEAPILAVTLPVAGLYFVFTGASSMAPFLLRRRLELQKLNVCEVVVAFAAALLQLLLAYTYRNIWSLVVGGVLSAFLTMLASYYLLPNYRYRVYICKAHLREILHFGKWIFVSSIIYFLSTNFDRLSLGKMVPLEMLGIYGIARNIADLVTLLFLRLGDFVIFPLVASFREASRHTLRKEVGATRFWSLLLLAAGISALCLVADIVVNILFDPRYMLAGAILPVLSIGIWFSILCATNEAVLLGFARPQYSAIANVLKLSYLVVCLPTSFKYFGIFGVATTIALADICRYFPVLFGQIKERFSFAVQDALLTLILFTLVGGAEVLRWHLGFGTSFDGLMQMMTEHH